MFQARPHYRQTLPMKNFRRALVDAARYWPRLAVALLCSALAAGLWSANIAALFPILEVSLRGEAPQAWNQRRIAESVKRLANLDRKIADQRAELAAAPEAKKDAFRHTLNELLLARRGESLRHASIQGLQPWLVRFIPADPFRFIVLVAVLLLVSTAVKQGLQFGGGMLIARVSQLIARDIRQKVFDKTLTMDRGSFLAKGPGGFSAQITHTSEMLANGIQSVFGGAVSEPLKLLACMIGAALISWRLLLASLIFAPLAGWAMLWINRRLRSVAGQTLQRSQGIHHVMLESLQNMATVQIFGMEEQERKRFRNSTGGMMRWALRAAFYNHLVAPVTEIVGVSVICVAIVLGAYLLLHGEQTVFGITLMERPLGISAMMVFFGMLFGASDPVRRMTGVVTGINMGMAAADNLYPLLDQTSRVPEPDQPLTVPQPHRELRFNNVTFGYHAEHPVLRDLSVTIPFGETVAIVGANGTGKSTLVNLLCRFYDPQQGAITLDGVPLCSMSLANLRSRIAVVAQHTELFNESLLYNIRYGRAGATDDEARRAAELARAHEFIETIPTGYETLAGPSGMRLSGGQRQRIALARALLRDPEVLILDEATSQIDVESERLIHDVLASFRGTRTIILITHRESALALADRIIRLRPGAAEIVDNRLRKAA